MAEHGTLMDRSFYNKDVPLEEGVKVDNCRDMSDDDHVDDAVVVHQDQERVHFQNYLIANITKDKLNMCLEYDANVNLSFGNGFARVVQEWSFHVIIEDTGNLCSDGKLTLVKSLKSNQRRSSQVHRNYCYYSQQHKVVAVSRLSVNSDTRHYAEKEQERVLDEMALLQCGSNRRQLVLFHQIYFLTINSLIQIYPYSQGDCTVFLDKEMIDCKHENSQEGQGHQDMEEEGLLMVLKVTLELLMRNVMADGCTYRDCEEQQNYLDDQRRMEGIKINVSFSEFKDQRVKMVRIKNVQLC